MYAQSCVQKVRNITDALITYKVYGKYVEELIVNFKNSEARGIETIEVIFYTCQCFLKRSVSF